MVWLARWLKRSASTEALTKGHRADFHAPVGTVNAPTHQHIYNLGNGLDGNLPVPGSPLSAALLIDRVLQEQAIRAQLRKAKFESGGWPPLLIVLPGGEDASHGTFVSRFCIHDLRQLVKDDDDSCETLHCLRWPQGTRDLSAVLQTVRQGLCLPEQYDEPELFLDWMGRRLPQSLCFAHRITSRSWASDETLVRAWVDFLLGVWPNPPGHRIVVAFLLLEYSDSEGGGLRRYVSELEARTANEARLLVAPELGLVSRDDVRDWVDDLARRNRTNVDLVARAQPLPDHLFPVAEQPRPFMDVYTDILEFLKTSHLTASFAVETR